MLARHSAYTELSGGGSTWAVAETMAVRGDRLTLQRRRIEFANSNEIEWLAVALYTPDMMYQRAVIFDPDDDRAALALLDELHTEHPEPVEPGAVEQQLRIRRDIADELRRRASERDVESE
jgi:hypothetical protein